MWRRAEALGFAHAWTYDHIAWGPLRDSAWFGAVPTLAAAALVTSTIRLGTLVASPNFRHPVPFARELITLDDLAAGRFTLGIGAGGIGWDATILGQDPWSPEERADRFAEFVAQLDQLLRGPVTTAAGRFYAADAVRNHPGMRPASPASRSRSQQPDHAACGSRRNRVPRGSRTAIARTTGAPLNVRRRRPRGARADAPPRRGVRRGGARPGFARSHRADRNPSGSRAWDRRRCSRMRRAPTPRSA